MSGSARKRAIILAIVATDSTFARARAAGRPLDSRGLERGAGDETFVGKCLHCGATLVIDLDGEPRSHATIEHILPRSHGGTDALENLGLACARCNAEKGVRHDSKRTFGGRLAEVVQALAEKRRARWVDPSDELRERYARLLERSAEAKEKPKKRR
jgi:5-methylcytosine-specific restriction endonuclease McrA